MYPQFPTLVSPAQVTLVSNPNICLFTNMGSVVLGYCNVMFMHNIQRHIYSTNKHMSFFSAGASTTTLPQSTVITLKWAGMAVDESELTSSNWATRLSIGRVFSVVWSRVVIEGGGTISVTANGLDGVFFFNLWRGQGLV